MSSNLTISICNLELNLMVSIAKQRYTTVENESATFDLDAMNIGFDLGSRKIALTVTMRESLQNIKVINPSIYKAFVYAYAL
ncbi:hypothetical protein, partial [Vibrio parahaemolyticus]|uniref:hypothetical protein n=1 Tax=Vibrio parahaemolyticus TaxID=670 RepID=UPI001BAE7736